MCRCSTIKQVATTSLSLALGLGVPLLLIGRKPLKKYGSILKNARIKKNPRRSLRKYFQGVVELAYVEGEPMHIRRIIMFVISCWV